MSRSRYFKLSGGGNDFIAFAGPGEAPRATEVRTLCRRGISLGADGLFTLEQRGGGVRMRYWNADGTAAALCLNGTRCAAALAFHLDWATDRVMILTDAGSLAAEAAGGHRIALEAPVPRSFPEPMKVEVLSGAYSGWRITIGVPHFVVLPESDLQTLPVTEAGSQLRRAPTFAPAGTNVDFARLQSQHDFDLRSYERGVEAETLACGTGILAVVAVGVATGRLRFPIRARTRGGFEFEVDGTSRGERIEAWSLSGDARILASGELEEGASVTPS